MPGLTSGQIRNLFLDYFRGHDHLVIPSSSLIPPKESGLLFTTAGVTQVIPYLLGHAVPPAQRLASVQKVFRTTDIDEVGDDIRTTFFEMLGNWSVGDYFKREAIVYAWDLSINGLALDPGHIWVTVHPDDEVSPQAWRDVGIPPQRIVSLSSNWWPEEAAPGPCGPDSELYYDRGIAQGCGSSTCAPGCECSRFVEFWNLVFMQYDRAPDGALHPLPQQNVDTGMGLERMACIQQGVKTVYETSDFYPLINTIAERAHLPYRENTKRDRSFRIIADHSRAATFLLADNVRPANDGRGYVLRRIIRRAVRHAILLDVRPPFLADLAVLVIRSYGDAYPELQQRSERILQILNDEERRFVATLEAGMTAFERIAHDLESHGQTLISGRDAFTLYDSRGLPLEVLQEVATEHGLTVDVAGFQAEMARQVEAGRQDYRRHSTGAVGEIASESFTRLPPTEFTGYEREEDTAQVLHIVRDNQRVDQANAGDPITVVLDRTPFYVESGGQVSDMGVIAGDDARMSVRSLEKLPSGVVLHHGILLEGYLHEGDSVLAQVDVQRRANTRRNHTATHLLHRALRCHLGEHVEQAGSLVAPDRLTFDFTHGSRLTPEELAAIEREVNNCIQQNWSVKTTIKPLAEATAGGAMALFGEKYADLVRVVSIDDYSKELCGGTHVRAIGEIGAFVIIAESGIGAGHRRIEAVTGAAAIDHIRQLLQLIENLSQKLKSPVIELNDRISILQDEVEKAHQQIRILQRDLLAAEATRLVDTSQRGLHVNIVAAEVSFPAVETLRTLADLILPHIDPGILLLAAPAGDRAQLLVAASPHVELQRFPANQLIKEFAQLTGGGGGGGTPRLATGSGQRAGVKTALATLSERILHQ
ncbi:MAG: alanine--tRNA ligase [Chloroflexi bacterium]|nr:alanine--tRNA ligase [Chloroflexota bacterium]